MLDGKHVDCTEKTDTRKSKQHSQLSTAGYSSVLRYCSSPAIHGGFFLQRSFWKNANVIFIANALSIRMRTWTSVTGYMHPWIKTLTRSKNSVGNQQIALRKKTYHLKRLVRKWLHLLWLAFLLAFSIGEKRLIPGCFFSVYPLGWPSTGAIVMRASSCLA